jgi:UDP-glucuronate 4-epimerase
MRILITGIAGMIGFHLANRLMAHGHSVEGVDDYNDLYYDSKLKYDRAKLLKLAGVKVHHADFSEINYNTYDLVVHLAAHAAVRVSMEKQIPYIINNVTRTQVMIEAIEKLPKPIPVVYASTSCVQHGQPLPWKESDNPGHQNNYYGMTKRMNECQFISSKIPVAVGLRFFTAYGPWGRPDMALYIFTKGIDEGKPIQVFNNGNMVRDFTYVEDVCQGVHCAINYAVSQTASKEIYNLGYGEQVQLMDFVLLISRELGKEPILEMRPRHPADVLETWSDTTKLQALGYRPTTPIDEGVRKFVDWYKQYEH